MARKETFTLEELQLYRNAIGDEYDQIIHQIWVLNIISKVLSSNEATKKYNCVIDMIKQSKKCQRWNFLAKIDEIERKSGFYSQNGKLLSRFGRSAFKIVRFASMFFKKSSSLWTAPMGRVVEEELGCYKERAKRLHALLLECYFLIKNKKNRSIHGMRKTARDEGHVPYEKVASSLHEEEVAVSLELQEKFNELEINSLEKRDGHDCVLCASYHVPKEHLQTTPLDLNDKVEKVDHYKCITLSEDFQISVRERLKENFPTLLDGVFCSHDVMKSKSRNTSKQQTFPHEIQGGSHPNDELKSESKTTQKVAQAFIDVANEYSMKSVFILADYRFESILKYVKGADVTKQEGDFDLIVIIPQIGIFFGQFKDTKDNGCNLKRCIYEASEQCQKDESVFKELFRDRIDMFDLPVYRFIALPHVSREALDKHSRKVLDKRNLTKCDLYNNILTKDDLKDEVCFKSWLSNTHGGAIVISDNCIINEEQYWTLLERFVGFGSEAHIDPYPKLVGDRCFQSPLTDEQWHLVNTDDKRFSFLTLAGDYGTGKSLILVKKALKIARKIQKDGTGKVIIIACSDICMDGEFLDQQFPEHMMHHLQKFCKDQYENIINVKTFKSFTQAESSDLSGRKGVDLLLKAISQMSSNDHLMFDEVPAKFVEKLQNHQEIVSDCLRSVKTVWFVIGTHSYRVRCDDSTSMRIEDCKPSSNFEYMYLNKVVRSPKMVFNVSQKISICSGDDHQGSLINSYKGPQPSLFRVPPCSCLAENHMSEPSSHKVESNPLQYECMEKRLTDTFRAIFYKIGIIKKDGKVVNKWQEKVTVLVFGVNDDSLFNDLHTLLIKCLKNFKGLCVRDTLKVERKQKGDCVSADQGAASRGGCSGVSFDSKNGLIEFESTPQDNQLATAVVGKCDYTSLVSEDDLVSKQITHLEVPAVGAGECTTSTKSRSSSEGSDRGDLGLLGLHRAEGVNSDGLECKNRNVPERFDCKENTKMDVDSAGRPEILLTGDTHFVGCESHVVICVELNAMKHWFKNTKVAFSTLAVSRCLSQYIHLTWHEKEAEMMYSMNVEACMADLDNNDKKNVNEAKEQSTSTLENLLKEGVITEQKVSMNT